MPAILAKLGLARYGPLFASRELDLEAFMHLTDEDIMTFLPEVSLGARIKMTAYIQSQKKQRGTKDKDMVDETQIAVSVFADMARTHQEHQRGRDVQREDVAAMVARVVEENNEKLLQRVTAMIEAARLGPPRAPVAPARELEQQPRSLNTDGATLWLEDDASKLVLGAGADTDLFRAGEGVLATGGAFQIGAKDDLVCDADATGALRWLSEKSSLQVCNGEKFKAAGGAVLDAADNEPCNSDSVGALQFDGSAKLLSVCDGTSFVNIFLADATAPAVSGLLSANGGIKLGDLVDTSAACDDALEGTIRFRDESMQACIKEKWRPFVASSCPTQVRCGDCDDCPGCVSNVFSLSGTCASADVGDACHFACPSGQIPVGAASLTCGPTMLWSSNPPSGCRDTQTKVFQHTGGDQSFTVPAGVVEIAVYMWGAGGGAADNSRSSGAGGYTEGTLPVSPGDSLVVIVGQGGHKNTPSRHAYGGGGKSKQNSASCGGGGGRSAVQRAGAPDTDLCTAGGGGGSGNDQDGSAGGGEVGVDGLGQNGTGGKGGSQTAGGAAGDPNNGCGDCVIGKPGASLVGGDSNPSANSCHQGAGGGGFFGGGSGGRDAASHDGGGGGGSGYIGGFVLGTGTTTAGSGKEPPDKSSQHYTSGIGMGKQCDCEGGHGRVVFVY